MVKVADNPWIYVGTNTSTTIECTLPNGIYAVYIKAVDKAGNYNVSRLVLIVDRETPSISVLEPQNNTYISVTTITVSWSISDNMDAFSKIRIDTGEWIYVDRALSYQTSLSEGQHTIEIMAIDLAGNTNITSITIYIDTTPPHLNIISPSDGETLHSNQITIEWNATDNYGIDYYLIRIDSGAWIRTTANNYTATFSDGEHIIIVRAYDRAGNYNESYIAVIIKAKTQSSTTRLETENTYSIDLPRQDCIPMDKFSIHNRMLRKILMST